MKKLALISVCVLGLAIAGSAMDQAPAKKKAAAKKEEGKSEAAKPATPATPAKPAKK